MNSVSSAVTAWPWARNGRVTASTANATGRPWDTTAGELACTEMQIAQGLELRAICASECACVASTAAKATTRKRQPSAIQRCQPTFAKLLFRFTVLRSPAKMHLDT